MSSPHASLLNVPSKPAPTPSTPRTTRQGSATTEPAPDERRSCGRPEPCALSRHRWYSNPAHYGETPGPISSVRHDGGALRPAPDDSKCALLTGLNNQDVIIQLHGRGMNLRHSRKSHPRPRQDRDIGNPVQLLHLSYVPSWERTLPPLPTEALRRTFSSHSGRPLGHLSRRPNHTSRTHPSLKHAYIVAKRNHTTSTQLRRQGRRGPPRARSPPPPGSGASLSSMVREADPPARTIPLFPTDHPVHLRVSVKPGIGHSAHPQTIPAVDKGKIRPSANIGSPRDLVYRRRSTGHASTDRSLVGSLPRLVEVPAGMSFLP